MVQIIFGYFFYVQAGFVKRLLILWGDLHLNIFKKDLLYHDRIYTYNDTLDVKNSILSAKYKNNIYYCYLGLKIINLYILFM